MQIKNLTNKDVEEVLKQAFIPKVCCNMRIDLPGGPFRQIQVEVFGYYVSMLVNEDQTMNSICNYVEIGFYKACHPPNFFERVWDKIKKWLHI